jgi:AraC family transcriptional regulator
LEPRSAAVALAGVATPDEPLHLMTLAQHAMAMRIAGFCAQRGTDLSLEALCLELLGSMDRMARPEPQSPPAWVQCALELLHDRYAEDLSIADIAGSVGVHPIHLARTFRRHFRCTPGEFARFCRLEKAVSLLARTSRPLAEVALISGFADQSHFSKTFVRFFGVPPGEYRILAAQNAGSSRRFRIDNTRPSRWAKVIASVAAARAKSRNRK